ncbi:MAG: VCBS repeat-containing protein, partial [Planctomycetota bacterium]|nr:VCBS repeat-containing protein [Planctomycetota bacterium]
MNRTHQMQAVGALTCLLIAGPAFAGGWVQFADETSTRLVADPSLGSNDTQEKDYAWGDLDHDGDTDLVVVRKQPFTTPGRRRNVLFMNEGIAEGHSINGVLVDRTNQYISGFLDETNDRDVVVADVDGDTWLDIITAPTYGSGLPTAISHPRVYMNQGEVAGVWQGFLYEQSRIPIFPSAPNFCGVAAGDVTGNGAVDLYFVDYDAGGFNNTYDDRLLINNGNGFFTDQSTARLPSGFLSSGFGINTVIADMNGDGWNDILKNEAGPVKTANNAGNGFFNIYETTYGGAAYFFNTGDLNNDGKLDIIVSDDGVDRYLLNLGNGANGMADFVQFTFPSSTNGFGSNSIIADLNNNGWPDVMTADVDVDIPGCTRVTDILRNDGNDFTVTFTANTGGIPTSMLQGIHDFAVIDLNGDCRLDLVIGTCNGTTVWINQAPDSACEPPVASGDITGPRAVPDGCVDAFDLGAMLGAWCSGVNDPNPPSPPCDNCSPANLAIADISGASNAPDGCIDAFDLAKLLAEWCSAAGGNPGGT